MVNVNMQNAMQAYGGVEVQLNAMLTSAPYDADRSNSRLGCCFLAERAPSTH
jgi:hypothetical protein